MKKLYILMSADRTLFKIGIGDEPLSRWKQLRGKFCEDESFYCSVSKGALRAEQMLHTLFSDFNKPRSGDGGTEWFDVGCLSEVEAFLEQNTVRLGLGERQRVDSKPRRVVKVKTTAFRLCIPREINNSVRKDATSLRRSAASIVLEIIENHYTGKQHVTRYTT
jgi:hypothetical protein